MAGGQRGKCADIQRRKVEILDPAIFVGDQPRSRRARFRRYDSPQWQHRWQAVWFRRL